MKIKHRHTGSEVDVPADKAARLVTGGSWGYIDRPAESVSKPTATGRQGDDTPNAGQVPSDQASSAHEPNMKPAPTIAEMRKWARENGVEGVPSKGKLPRHAVEAYMNAHKED